jgi:hypothetical protein
MKTTLTFLGFIGLQAIALAQTISATIAPNPVAAGDSVTISITYTNSQPTDIIQLNLERLDASYGYVSTIDYRDFTVPAAGTNQSVQYKVLIPAATPPSTSIGTDFYYYKIEIRDSAYNWYAGHYENPLTITAATVSIADDVRAEGLKVYPNPATDVLYIAADSFVPQSSTCSIVNSIGQTVAADVAIVNNSINISLLPKGVYLLLLDEEQRAIRFTKH